jgi:ubiquitin carboxyl-terminal hydrolase 5/13
VLVLSAKKFQLVNWVPAKLGMVPFLHFPSDLTYVSDIPLCLPADDVLVLDKYLGRGLQPGEDLLPDDTAAAPAAPAFNEAALAQLEGMGFPTIRCQKALLATGNSDTEAAMEWLFAHMEDPG